MLLDTGILPMREPITELVLEAPGGLVQVRAECRQGKAERITVTNVPSFADRLDAPLEVEGFGTLTVDTAYGGDSFVLVPAEAVGFHIAPDEAKDIAKLGVRITRAANEQLGFRHPDNPDLAHISFCQIVAAVRAENGIATGANAVAIEPGKIDRSPCGTGCSARMAVLHARGALKVGDRFVGTSIIGSRFEYRIESETTLGDRGDCAVDLRTRLDHRDTSAHARSR